MKSVLALALAASAAALPAADVEARQAARKSIFFTGVSTGVGRDIQYAPVAANGGNFWLNKNTATYTPTTAPVDTNRTTNTVFAFYLPSDTLFLHASVPGPQQVYVAADGALKYTAPKAAPPAGATFNGFGVAQAHLLFENTDFVAVATHDASNIPDGKGIAYQIYAASKFHGAGQGFRILANEFTGIPAWEYAS